MTENMPTPNDRASFDHAMAEVLADHATLRRLVTAATRQPAAISADDMMSIAEIMNTHELVEARLFALPFVTRTPEAVLSTATRARRRCLEYTSGSYRLPDANAAAALFVEALLAHLSAEEAWFAEERAHQSERKWISS